MSQKVDVGIYPKGNKYYSNPQCTTELADQGTAAALWRLKQSIEQGPVRPSRLKTFALGLLLTVLVLSALGILGASVVYWWPDLFQRLFQGPPSATSKTNQAAGESQPLADEFRNYSDRVSDLEKLISVLLGLSAIYTLALGLSSWASVQTNLQQAEKWVQSEQARMKEMKEQSKESVEELRTLLTDFKDELAYARAIPLTSASLALATQGKYMSDADLAIKTLVELRTKHSTDRLLNLYLGRTYRVLHRYENAITAMTVFIEAKEAANQKADADVADAYYNRACYRSLLWADPATPAPDKPALQTAIAEDVRKFRGIDQRLKSDVTGDTDFNAVRAEQWFKDALA
jgi:hypothetical protein